MNSNDYTLDSCVRKFEPSKIFIISLKKKISNEFR